MNGNVTVLSLPSLTRVGSPGVGGEPDSIAVDHRGNVYVANYLSGNVTIINGTTHAVMGNLLGCRNPVSIAITAYPIPILYSFGLH